MPINELFKGDNLDITNLTLEEAVALQKQLESALPNLKKQRLKGLQGEIRELVKKSGFTLDEVLTPLLQNPAVEEAETETKGKRKPAAVKYRLGDKTWTGKGREPSWIVEFKNKGGNRESLRVVAATESEQQSNQTPAG